MTTALTSARCFVHGVILNGDGSSTTLEAEPEPDQRLWIHLDYSEDDCTDILKNLGVPDNIIESLVRVNTRPRTLMEKDGFLIFLRAVNLNPEDEPDDMVSLRVWLESDRLITVRQRRVYFIQDIHKELKGGMGPRTIHELFICLVERLADRISEYVDNMEERLTAFEENVDDFNITNVRTEVSSLRRQVASVRRYLAPQRDALESFYRQSRVSFEERLVFELHEQSDRIVRYVEDLDLVKERCMVLQEELMNRIAQDQNARMYVLSIVAAIFLPISFITGLFGMNVAGLPGVDNPAAFLLVSGSMGIAVVGILSYFRFKRWV